MAATTLDEIVSLCKRRGLIFQSGELYGGIQGVYDYGPLGVEIKNNLKTAWWKTNVHQREDVLGLDTAILSHPLVFRYSGHEDTFADLLVDCRHCKRRWRFDHLIDKVCEHCGSTDLTEPRPFNMMFKTQLGPIEESGTYALLRPETAQGIFTNFKNVIDAYPKKLPFGLAQIGKAFRNEITPRNFIFRVREFEQMELEFFVKPGEDELWHQQWLSWRLAWWQEQGLSIQRLRTQFQEPRNLAHYAKATVDILYQFPHGFEELEGIANRTDFDLGSHSKAQDKLGLSAQVKKNTDSTNRLTFFDPIKQQFLVPYVIEPSAGLERGILALLTEAYHKESLENGHTRVVLKLKPHLAPIKVAIVPLAQNQISLVEKAKQLQRHLQTFNLGKIVLETSGNIGKSYRRHDEVGTPVCITVDFATLGKSNDAAEYDTVTVRERDSMRQTRIAISCLPNYLFKHLYSTNSKDWPGSGRAEAHAEPTELT